MIVEGSGSEWFVTLRGRRIPVTARTWRERLMADAERAATVHAGPVGGPRRRCPAWWWRWSCRSATRWREGAPLLTIEAMKMQNEVRAPRAGRVIEVSVASGVVVATGAALLRLE